MKISSRKILLAITITGLIVLLGIVFHFVFQDEVVGGLAQLASDATVFSQQKKTDLVGFPIRLRIPSISIDAAVEYVGLTSEGAVDVPAGSANVAWFNLGPRPGEVGNAVIDGHSGYKNNRPAVFDNLYKLKKGDMVYVQDGKGATITFVVHELKSYGRNQNALGVFDSNDGFSHLNLITCAGDWNAVARTHSDRLVIFTNKVGSENSAK